jgi:hypothetical protein
MPSLLERLGLGRGRRSGHHREPSESAGRAGELELAPVESREEAKGRELAQQIERNEKAAERLPRVERKLARAKERICWRRRCPTWRSRWGRYQEAGALDARAHHEQRHPSRPGHRHVASRRDARP